MQIDESRRYDQSGSVDLDLSTQRLRRDGGNLLPGDSDIPDSIQTGLRVEHAPISQNQVIGLRHQQPRREQHKKSHAFSKQYRARQLAV